jgi:hypothetical protein
MRSRGSAHGSFTRAINRRHVQAAEMAAREMGGLSLADALSLCELLANVDPARYERAALRWLERFIDERLPPLIEVALAASALAELRHGNRNVGIEALKRLLRDRQFCPVQRASDSPMFVLRSASSDARREPAPNFSQDWRRDPRPSPQPRRRALF